MKSEDAYHSRGTIYLTLEPVRKGFGLIVCKNVLLHFKEEERINVIRMFHDTLVEGGFFVTEQTQKMPVELESIFEPVVSNAQLFRKVG
jgi:chemotaxis protein methyltransferase CheR